MPEVGVPSEADPKEKLEDVAEFVRSNLVMREIRGLPPTAEGMPAELKVLAMALLLVPGLVLVLMVGEE
jgi:hypothetical protein